MSTIRTLLVTGGLGFIGSHTVVDVIQNTSAKVIIIDNLSNCFLDVLDRIKQILLRKFQKKQIDQRISFHQGDILDLTFLQSVFELYQNKKQPIQGIIHFAGVKDGKQSHQNPLKYYTINVVGSLNLFKIMEKYQTCTNFIFSSSAAVYGQIQECIQTDSKNPTHPYGQTKLCVQIMMNSLSKAHKNWKLIALRYFNPCGAHESGLLGDQPSGYPNSLFSFIQQVVIKKRQKLYVFGSDYQTFDGTCIRDFIHIEDLAKGHVAALKKLPQLKQTNLQAYNLGTGSGLSVLQIVKQYQRALGKPINYEFSERRIGDVISIHAIADKAQKQLGWKTTKGLKQMCQDSVKFILKRNQRINKNLQN